MDIWWDDGPGESQRPRLEKADDSDWDCGMLCLGIIGTIWGLSTAVVLVADLLLN